MTKAKIKQRVKPCPVPSDLCNDVCIYGTPCIRPRLWKTAYEQGKKDAYKEILKKAEATELTDLDDFFDWLEEASE
jgi:hypothetical protein